MSPCSETGSTRAHTSSTLPGFRQTPLPDCPPDVNGSWTMVLSYQRSGSTYVASMFQGDQRRVFYIYEPLDPLYSAMYGADEGWAVPSDIFNWKNGSLRYTKLFHRL